MNEKRLIAERIAQWLKSQVEDGWGWQKRSADLLEISPSHMGNILAGRQVIGAETRDRLRAAGADVDWIMTGKRSDSDVMSPTVALARIAVYRLRGEEGKGYMLRDHPADYIMTSRRDDPSLFGVLVPDGSMSPDVLEGDVLVVSKEETAKDGDLVLATMKGGHLLIRRFSTQHNNIILTATDNRLHPPQILRRSQVQSVWRVVQRVQNF